MIHPLPTEFSDRPICIAVAGMGGTGSQVLSGLARMHYALAALGHPGLDVYAFDPDKVTEANIGRQLFSPADLGANKAAVLIHRINCFFNLSWTAIPSLYKSGQRWCDEKADILIGCVDSAAARRDLAKTKYRYWLDIGNDEKKGQVILGTRTRPKRIPIGKPLAEVFADADKPRKIVNRQSSIANCYAPPRPKLVTEIFPELKNPRLKEDNTPSCSLAEALERQDLFINQTVATFAMQLLWQFIRQGGLDIHGYFINLETGRVTPLPIK
jgi:PRTRC genetic system ThiF family protein